MALAEPSTPVRPFGAAPPGGMSGRGMDGEREARSRLAAASHRPVAFAVRANVDFSPDEDDDSPVHGAAVTFATRDFLHIKEKFNTDWWIGRVVRDNSSLGFVPSPAKLEVIKAMKIRAAHKGRKGSLSITNLAADTSLGPPPSPTGPLVDFDSDLFENADGAAMSPSHTQSKKRGNLFKKPEVQPAYDVVPNMRPLVLVGPSLKGYEVTDMMQKAVFDYLKHRFEHRIIITRVQADVTQSKRSMLSAPAVRRVIAERSARRRRGGTAAAAKATANDVQGETERIFELARTMQLLVLDCDTVNHPVQLSKTALAPLIVYIKIASPKVLQRLIKSRGKAQSRNMNVQMVAAEKLAQCPPEMLDLVLDENQLEDACAHLADFMEEYWRATHPPAPPGSATVASFALGLGAHPLAAAALHTHHLVKSAGMQPPGDAPPATGDAGDKKTTPGRMTATKSAGAHSLHTALAVGTAFISGCPGGNCPPIDTTGTQLANGLSQQQTAPKPNPMVEKSGATRAAAQPVKR